MKSIGAAFATYTILILIDIVLFFYVPTGIMLFVAVIPATIYSIWHFKKWMIGLTIFIVVMLGGALIVLPVIAQFASDISILYDFYMAIYPESYFYRWIDNPPTFIYGTLAFTVLLLLFIELIFWCLKKLFKIQSAKNQMYVFSIFLSTITIIYTIFSYSGLLYPPLLDFINMYVAATLVHDFLFQWIPFVAVFFLLKYIKYVFLH